MAVPKYELIPIAKDDPRKGLALLPPPSKYDVFFDMEGYPYVDGGLEYLFGASYFDGKGKLCFQPFWAHDHAQEKVAFEKFVDWVYKRWQMDPSMHIYHYADYEVSALRRLMGRHASREQKVDDLLRNEVFVNLYNVVRQAMQVGTPSYSMKLIEHLYREKRRTDVVSATDSIVFYQRWIEEQDGDDVRTSAILQDIEAYNKDDCDSTAQLALWLRKVQRDNKIGYVHHRRRMATATKARPLRRAMRPRRSRRRYWRSCRRARRKAAFTGCWRICWSFTGARRNLCGGRFTQLAITRSTSLSKM